MKERKKASKLLLAKIVILIVAAAACMVILVVTLSSMQTNLYLESYVEDIDYELDNLPEALDEAAEEVDGDSLSFDQTYQTLAESVAFMANHDAGFARTNEQMIKYKNLFGVDNVLLVDQEGNIIAQAASTRVDYRSSRFNRLRAVFENKQHSDKVEIELDDGSFTMRYYSAYIDPKTMVVIEKDPTELHVLTEENGSDKSVLEHIVIGRSGYIFTVSELRLNIGYHPNPDLVGTDAIYDGIKIEDLKDGNYTWINLDGQELYCGVRLIGNTYYIAAVPKSDMTSARNVTVFVILFITFVVLAVILVYGIFVTRQNEQQGTDPADVVQFRHVNINKVIARRAGILSLVGLLVIIVVSFYMQTLFALSSKFASDSVYINEVVESIDRSDQQLDEFSEEYVSLYLPVVQSIGYILDENPDLINHADLLNLAQKLQIENIYVFDADSRRLLATSSSYTNYSLTEDPEDPNYGFIKLLQADLDYVIQEPAVDSVSGELWQWLGVATHDEEGYVDGVVIITFHPSLLEALEKESNIGSQLENAKHGSTSFTFAINKEDNTFAYLPINEYAEGESVLDHDMTEDDLYGGYTDYVTIDGTKYFVASAETDDYYIFLGSTGDEVMDERLPLTIATTIITLLCLAALFLLLIFEPKRNLRDPDQDPDPDGQDGDVKISMPDGRTVKTDSAASRWSGVAERFKWNEKTSWQKAVTVLEWLLIILVAIICVAVIFQNQIFGENSMFGYILGGDWARGLNIFAVTACIMISCVVITLVWIARRLLLLLATILNARGETACRLIRSFLRYGALIGLIFYCLALLGVDVVTLLVSAGIFALAISLGAQSIISDIIAGLFVIFEGEFRVGDIITVGDWRGTVLEIGIRTTKVEDPSQNVKVIRNSDLTSVINMTKKLSFVAVNYAIEYNESLERVETILAKELPEIKKRLPAIVHGPYYRGVAAWSDSSVDLKIIMQCEEKDRMQLERDFNRQMRLLFDKYDINIPFPQVVVNEPTVPKKASAYEKWLAQQFNEEQKEASKEMGANTEDVNKN